MSSRRMPLPRYADRATDYARRVVRGDVAACDNVRLACSRHLADLEASAWVWDRDRADYACRLIEAMRHTKGAWARRGENIRLEDWQCFIVCSLFGWVDDRGLRRYRQAFVLVPRKNAKSTLAAAIGLVLAFCDGEAGAEVYAGATSEKQAWEVFGPAQKMARGDFEEAFGVKVAARSIFAPEDGSRFQPIIGKPGDGSSPHCAIVDEYHEHATPEQFDTMLTGMGAREQPLMFVITTAGDNVAGPCFEMQRHCEDVLRGTVRDDRLFALLYGIDAEDDWRDFDVWRKANPNIGVSISEDYLRDRHAEALARPQKQGVNLTKHLNVWVRSRSAWLNRAKWEACGRPGMVPEDFAGHDAWIGCDLASKIDIAAVVARVSLPDGGAAIFPRFYLPESQLGPGGKNSAAYAAWAADGHLIVTPGDTIDFEKIQVDVREWLEVFRVHAVCFDPWQSQGIRQALERDGVRALELGMSARNLSAPMVEFEAGVESGTLLHPANPCLTWMAGNVTAREDARGNKYPRKPDGHEHLKIDGIMAALMATAAAIRAEGDGGSVYDDRGIVLV